MVVVVLVEVTAIFHRSRHGQPVADLPTCTPPDPLLVDDAHIGVFGTFPNKGVDNFPCFQVGLGIFQRGVGIVVTHVEVTSIATPVLSTVSRTDTVVILLPLPHTPARSHGTQPEALVREGRPHDDVELAQFGMQRRTRGISVGGGKIRRAVGGSSALGVRVDRQVRDREGVIVLLALQDVLVVLQRIVVAHDRLLQAGLRREVVSTTPTQVPGSRRGRVEDVLRVLLPVVVTVLPVAPPRPRDELHRPDRPVPLLIAVQLASVRIGDGLGPVPPVQGDTDDRRADISVLRDRPVDVPLVGGAVCGVFGLDVTDRGDQGPRHSLATWSDLLSPLLGHEVGPEKGLVDSFDLCRIASRVRRALHLLEKEHREHHDQHTEHGEKAKGDVNSKLLQLSTTIRQ